MTAELDELRAVVWTCEACHEAVPLVVGVDPALGQTPRAAAVFLSTPLPEACPHCGHRIDVTRAHRTRLEHFLAALVALVHARETPGLVLEFRDAPPRERPTRG